MFPRPLVAHGRRQYMLGSDFAKYPHVLGTRARVQGRTPPQDAFIDFVNQVEAYAASRPAAADLERRTDRRQHRARHPGTTVEHWLDVKVKPSTLIAQGYP